MSWLGTSQERSCKWFVQQIPSGDHMWHCTLVVWARGGQLLAVALLSPQSQTARISVASCRQFGEGGRKEEGDIESISLWSFGASFALVVLMFPFGLEPKFLKGPIFVTCTRGSVLLTWPQDMNHQKKLKRGTKLELVRWCTEPSSGSCPWQAFNS